MNGKIKWVNEKKGYAFIQSEDGKEIFIHKEALQSGIDFKSLKEGDEITFDFSGEASDLAATNVRKSKPDDDKTDHTGPRRK